MATHSSILAWEIPQTEGPGGLQSKELQRVRHNWAAKNSSNPFSTSLDSICLNFVENCFMLMLEISL